MKNRDQWVLFITKDVNQIYQSFDIRTKQDILCPHVLYNTIYCS